jgi:hypothetical protein
LEVQVSDEVHVVRVIYVQAGDGNMFGGDGFPKQPFPNGWKGENGLYAVGFGRKGLLGVAHDANKAAEDIARTFT